MILVAQGTRGLQGWNISGQVEGVFSPEWSGRTKESFQVFSKASAVHKKLCMCVKGLECS